MRRIGSKVARCLVVAVLCALPVQAMAAVNAANTVNSAAIIAADGTSGQTLTTGNGVKTGHIQNKAITNAKIFGNISGTKLMPKSVTTTQLADSAVTAEKLGIVCPTGNFLQYVTGSGWVCSVGTAGPQGPTGLTGAVGATGAQGPAGVTPHYANVAVVAKSGGDFSDPASAMSNVASWCGTPSATNPCLLKIMPGIYNLGSTPLNMVSYVDVEGSGSNNSKIIGTVMYYITSFTELKMVSIESGSGPYGRAIDMRYSAYNKLKGVSISVPSASIPGGFDGAGIYSFDPQGALTIEDSIISADEGYALVGFLSSAINRLDTTQLVINNSRFSVTGPGETISNSAYTHFSANGLELSSNVLSYGISNYAGCDMTIKNSSIKAGLDLVRGEGVHKLVTTQLDGPGGNILSGIKCINVYDANLNPITCQ